MNYYEPMVFYTNKLDKTFSRLFMFGRMVF